MDSPPAPSGDARVVCLLGIDTVREKTLYQTRWLAAHGVEVHVLTSHRDTGSVRSDASATITMVESGVLARLSQVLRYLLAHRRRLHHVELYVGGRLAFAYAVLCRLLRIPVLVVERGDLLFCLRRLYPLLMRLSIYACYLLATRIWLREVYMLAPMARWRLAGKCFHLPNGVPIPDLPERPEPRDIDFLWANRLIPERHPDWFAAAVRELASSGPVTCVVLGFALGSQGDRTEAMQNRVRDALTGLESCECLPFQDPHPYFRRARYFVLPSDVVFGNFALLEAMARGVVPIVSDTEGADRVVHGRNGYLVAHEPDALLAAMRSARALPDAEWRALSDAARQTVIRDYSLDQWGRRLLAEYGRLDRR